MATESSSTATRSPGAPRARQRLTRAVVLAVAAWATWAFLLEGLDAVRGRERHPLLYPSGWILGGPQVEPLRAYLDLVDRRLPRGATVIVGSHAWDNQQLHYLTMWTAYYLPRHHVVHYEFRHRQHGVRYQLMIPPPPEPPAAAERVGLPIEVTAAPAALYRLSD